ncbi:MAG: Uncharacterized protein FD167_4727 [bacterium]|nr:MAG: Uncharacterized protein FD167_4727 [bacterium]
MPKIRCQCDTIINYGQIPCPNEWLTISDIEFDSFSGMIDAESLYTCMKSMLQCPKCGRLYIFWNGFDSDPQEYVPSKS